MQNVADKFGGWDRDDPIPCTPGVCSLQPARLVLLDTSFSVKLPHKSCSCVHVSIKTSCILAVAYL